MSFQSLPLLRFHSHSSMYCLFPLHSLSSLNCSLWFISVSSLRPCVLVATTSFYDHIYLLANSRVSCSSLDWMKLCSDASVLFYFLGSYCVLGYTKVKRLVLSMVPYANCIKSSLTAITIATHLLRTSYCVLYHDWRPFI